MKTLFITYSLDNYEEAYAKIRDRLKKYPNWAKLFSRTWIIKTSRSPKHVRDELESAIGGKGHIIVIDITGSTWATYNVEETVLEWMKGNV